MWDDACRGKWSDLEIWLPAGGALAAVDQNPVPQKCHQLWGCRLWREGQGKNVEGPEKTQMGKGAVILAPVSLKYAAADRTVYSGGSRSTRIVKDLNTLNL